MNRIEDDKLHDLIRQAYAPQKDLKIPMDLTARIRQKAMDLPQQRSYFPTLRIWVNIPAYRLPVLASALSVFLIIGITAIIWNRSTTDETHLAPEKAAGLALNSVKTTGEHEDPLGLDFFHVDLGDENTLAVDLAEGWNAMTIEDENSGTALVYFYEKNLPGVVPTLSSSPPKEAKP